jgi:amino acid transporter
MRQLDRPTVALLALAALLAVAQFVSAFFVHVAVRAVPTGSDWVAPPTKTYLQAFGVSEVILTLLSLAAIVVVGSVLRRRRMRGESGAGWLAWGVSAAVALFVLFGFVSLFGAGVCLLLACVSVPRRQPMATIGASSARPPVEPLKTASP